MSHSTIRRIDRTPLRRGLGVARLAAIAACLAALTVVGCRSSSGTPAASAAVESRQAEGTAVATSTAIADAAGAAPEPAAASQSWYGSAGDAGAGTVAEAPASETMVVLDAQAPLPTPDAKLAPDAEAASAMNALGSDESLRRRSGSRDAFRGGGAVGGGGALAPRMRAAREDAAEAQASQVPIIRGPFDEVWVIARDRDAVGPPQDGEIPGIGSLGCVVPGAPPIPMPLLSSDYRVRVQGPVAETTCIQKFKNTFTEPVEAIYVFPLPHRAAVADFVLVVGERRIRGIVRDRAEAEQIYREAKQAGFTASLLREDRPNVFTEKIANLPPQVPVDVELTWFEALGYDAGSHELALPLVVAPRWNACGASDAVLPAAAPFANAVANAAGDEATVVPYLPAGDDGTHRISIAVEIDAGKGVAIGSIESPTHAITVARARPRCPTLPEEMPLHLASVTLAEETSVPNRDFVLRWQVAGETPRASIVASRDADGAASGHLLLTLYPPEQVAELPRPAIDLAILLDRSGSMNGQPLEAAQRAVEAILASLGPNDRVLLGSFSNNVVFAEPLLAAATPERLARLKAWTGQVRAGGGTNLLEGLDAVLFGARELEDAGRRQALVILTDGLSGDEGRIIKLAHDQRGVQEIHCLGIGDSTNRFLIDELARAGDGTSGIVLLGSSVDPQVLPVIGAVQTAAIVNPSLDLAETGVVDVVPSRLQTLRPGRPIVITARWEGEGERELVVAGTVGTTAIEVPIAFMPPSAEASEANRRALSKVWARATIAEMSETGRRGEVLASGETALEGIRRVAIEHGLVSPLTSFVAVDASEALPQPGTRTIRQAVPVPQGIDPTTTIPGAIGATSPEGGEPRGG
jgi:Ca-activated chloride channel homolog